MLLQVLGRAFLVVEDRVDPPDVFLDDLGALQSKKLDKIWRLRTRGYDCGYLERQIRFGYFRKTMIWILQKNDDLDT